MKRKTLGYIIGFIAVGQLIKAAAPKKTREIFVESGTFSDGGDWQIWHVQGRKGYVINIGTRTSPILLNLSGTPLIFTSTDDAKRFISFIDSGQATLGEDGNVIGDVKSLFSIITEENSS